MTTTAPRLLQVRRTAHVTPRMIRVTLGGSELAGFPGDGPDRRIKMFFPPPGEDVPAVPRASTGGPVWPPGQARPAIRTYTVRRFDADAGELDVDFVVHDGHGPAADWAQRAGPGSWVGVSEPGGRWTPDADADFHVVIGDESALPAVATVLETLAPGRPGPGAPDRDGPDTTAADTGTPNRAPDTGGAAGGGTGAPGVDVLVFLEVADAGEEQELPVPVRWVHRGDAPAGERLVAAVRAATFPPGRGQAWLSGESAAVRDLRAHLLDDRGLDRRTVYATGYWRAR